MQEKGLILEHMKKELKENIKLEKILAFNKFRGDAFEKLWSRFLPILNEESINAN